MLASPLMSSFQSCRSASPDNLDAAPQARCADAECAPQPLPSLAPFSPSSSPASQRATASEQPDRADASLRSVTRPTSSSTTAETLLRMRASRRRSSVSPRLSASGREAPSESSSLRFFLEGDSAEVVQRKQRVDRAMLGDREAEGRHTLHREEQDMYMRFLVPFYQLLRECLRKSVNRDDALQQCRRFSDAARLPSTPCKARLESPASPRSASSSRSRPSEGSGMIFGRQTEVYTATITSVAPVVGLPVSPEPRVPPARRCSSSPFSTSPIRYIHGDVDTSRPLPGPSSMGHVSMSSPRQGKSAERVLIELLNAEEQETLEASERYFVGRVSWLLAEEVVARAEVCAAEAYAWHCVRALREKPAHA